MQSKIRQNDERVLEKFKDLKTVNEEGISNTVSAVFGSEDRAVAFSKVREVAKDVAPEEVKGKVRLPLASLWRNAMTPYAAQYRLDLYRSSEPKAPTS